MVICTYGDDAGNAQRESLASLFGRPRCEWVRYPEGHFSLREVFRKLKTEGGNRPPSSVDYFAGNLLDGDLPEPPNNPAFDTGIVGLREHYRVRRGDLCVVSGVPSAGKTSFVNELVGRMALTHGWRTVFASFEQRPIPDHKRAFRTFHDQKLENIFQRQNAQRPTPGYATISAFSCQMRRPKLVWIGRSSAWPRQYCA